MSVKVVDNTPQVRLHTNQKASLFLREFMEEAHRIAKPITPKDKGDLKNQVLKKALGNKATMEWRKVYASVQERGTIKGSVIRHYTTAGTGPHYAEKGVRGALTKTTQIAKKVGLA